MSFCCFNFLSVYIFAFVVLFVLLSFYLFVFFSFSFVFLCSFSFVIFLCQLGLLWNLIAMDRCNWLCTAPPFLFFLLLFLSFLSVKNWLCTAPPFLFLSVKNWSRFAPPFLFFFSSVFVCFVSFYLLTIDRALLLLFCFCLFLSVLSVFIC